MLSYQALCQFSIAENFTVFRMNFFQWQCQFFTFIASSFCNAVTSAPGFRLQHRWNAYW